MFPDWNWLLLDPETMKAGVKIALKWSFILMAIVVIIIAILYILSVLIQVPIFTEKYLF